MDEWKGTTTAPVQKIVVAIAAKDHITADVDHTAGAAGSAYYSCGSLTRNPCTDMNSWMC